MMYGEASRSFVLFLGAWALALAGCSDDQPPVSPPAEEPPLDAGPPRLELVGHSDLGARGMNAALAVAGTTVYVGSRTEGETHQNTGVLVVDVADPALPTVVGEIGPPDEALLGMSSRELRAIPDDDRLFVLNFSCSPQIHACSRSLSKYPETGGAAEGDNLKVYDISDRLQPALIGMFAFGSFSGDEHVKPHEMFLWRDPERPGRSLLYVTTPQGPPSVQVLDVSDPAAMHVVATWDAQDDAGLPESRSGAYAHSISVSDDGNVGYLAYLGAGFFTVDTSDLAAALPAPQIRLRAPIEARVDYVPPEPVGTHSAVPIPGRDLVLLTDEVYPPPVQTGCPWGWGRLVDVADVSAPAIVSELRIAENDPAACPDEEGGPAATTFTAHNPTVTSSLAFVTWHSGGLQVIDLSDPRAPVTLTSWKPDPIAAVAVEDPMFRGNPVALWSYPVIRDGLIYVIDVRNGLYVLRYRGPHEQEAAGPGLREGNSNVR